jgi:hypothetical protein
MRRILSLATLGLIVVAVAVGTHAFGGRAADHLDSPLVQLDGRLDITDVYVFPSPATPANTVLVLAVSPLAGVMSMPSFNPDAAYEFRIDTDGDAVADITITATFSPADAANRQQVTLTCAPVAVCERTQGMTETNLPVSGGMLRAGLFDDPFFFDLDAFKHDLAFCQGPGGTGTNFFAGLNVMAIVLELPTARLGTKLGVWGRTALAGQTVDRMGRPAINTVFMPPEMKGAFNAGVPANDRRDFRDRVVAVLKTLGNDDARAGMLADVLLPDILTYDATAPAGFPNGRRLSDDVIDIALGLISNGAVTTDCVANDSAFTATFPYLAPPNP